MSPMAISWVVFACTFAGALLGVALRRGLPEHHINEDFKDIVKLGMGLIATMAALVLALLIASAKSYHDLQSTEVSELASDFILLDRTLARYGPETRQARSGIPITIKTLIDQTWSGDSFRSESMDRAFGPHAEIFYGEMRQIEPHTEFQRAVYAQVMQIGMELGRKRSFLLEQKTGSIPTPFLVVLVFWLALIFASFGLFAPTNWTTIGVLIACALSVAAAIFMILELDRPFQGMMQVSSAPLRNALTYLGK